MISNSRTRLLIVGCGDIGIRLAKRLSREKLTIFGLRRNIVGLPSFISPLACDLNDAEALKLALDPGFDFVVFTLTPSESSEQAYRQMFCNNLKIILEALCSAACQPKYLLFVSSTSVYAQNNGEWIDEESPTNPTHYRGQKVLAAERMCLESEIPTTIIRFSGIYGPGRERLVNQVRQRQWSPQDQQWTNRIHSEDAAAVLAWCIQKAMSQESLEMIYLCSDNAPAPKNEVCAWMAKQAQVPLPEFVKSTTNTSTSLNKRCSNQRLRRAGFQFAYPAYREGYRQLLAKQALESTGLLENLNDYHATVVSTIWVGLDIEGSDIDILCEYRNRETFIVDVRRLFESYESFSLSVNERRVLVQFEKDGFMLEIFACTTPVEEQAGYRHFQVMRRLVKLGGSPFQAAIRGLKTSGLKTEPAIAKALGLSGDPYQAVSAMVLESWTGPAIRASVKNIEISRPQEG